MSKLLTTPKEAVQLNRVRIANFTFEDNPAKGQRWIEVYIVLGRLEVEGDESSFRQYVDPETGAEVFRHLKLENGVHPLAPGRALGKCGTCGEWSDSAGGPCIAEGCGGTNQPYDGAIRFVLSSDADQACGYHNFKEHLYRFLAAEEVPDPVTWEMVRLLDVEE